MLDRAEAGLDDVRGGLDAHHTAVPVALQEQGGQTSGMTEGTHAHMHALERED